MSMQLQMYAWLKKPKLKLMLFWFDFYIFHFYCLLALPFDYDSAMHFLYVTANRAVTKACIFLTRNEQTKEVYFICNSILYYASLTWVFVPFAAVHFFQIYLQWHYVCMESVDHSEQWQKFIFFGAYFAQKSFFLFFFLLPERRHECACAFVNFESRKVSNTFS